MHGEEAGDDPWDAWTLEWATTSPPPEYNFEKLPVVRSSRPLWDLKHPQDPDWRFDLSMWHEATTADAVELGKAWNLPDRGKVGIAFLIITESALFTIFVVAYLVYIGKSLTGPQPKDVLELPILASICLFSSSATIVLAERALHRGALGSVQIVVGTYYPAGVGISCFNRGGMVHADLQGWADNQHESFRHNFLCAGGPACESRDCRHAFSAAGFLCYDGRVSHSNAVAACDVSFLVLALCRCDLGGGVHAWFTS